MREVPAPSQEDVNERIEIFKVVDEINQQFHGDGISLPDGNPQGITAKAFLLLERYQIYTLLLHISSFNFLNTHISSHLDHSEPNHYGHRVVMYM